MLLFNGYCPVLIVSQAFGKSKELRQVTSSNVVTGLQKKRFGTRISPSTLSCQGFNTLEVGFLTSDVRGMGLGGGGCQPP